MRYFIPALFIIQFLTSCSNSNDGTYSYNLSESGRVINIRLNGDNFTWTVEYKFIDSFDVGGGDYYVHYPGDTIELIEGTFHIDESHVIIIDKLIGKFQGESEEKFRTAWNAGNPKISEDKISVPEIEIYEGQYSYPDSMIFVKN